VAILGTHDDPWASEWEADEASAGKFRNRPCSGPLNAIAPNEVKTIPNREAPDVIWRRQVSSGTSLLIMIVTRR
jgi:hypothetical protein